MTNYSIGYLDAAGHTKNSELLPFEDNRTAIDFARIGLVRSAIVEVWKDGDLIDRLYRNPPAARVATGGVPNNAVGVFARTSGGNGLHRWDNEGGAALSGRGASR